MPKPAEVARIIEGYDEEDWLDFLDELDAVTRRRRQRKDEPEQPTGNDRDAMAEWIARKHFLADRSIRQIWYLPGNSPSDEIRLVEVMYDDLAVPEFSSQHPIEAIEFALDMNDNPFHLFVVDVFGHEVDHINSGRLSLPQGWTLDGRKIWGRRA